MIIGITGKLESGKTTTANFLKEFHPVKCKIAFADLLKEMIINSGLCKREELYENKTDFSRLMMQKIGTEIIRQQVSKDFWVEKMRDRICNAFTHYQIKGKDFLIVIDDIRFLNEAKLVQQFQGKIVKIHRDKDDSQLNSFSTHLSETELDLINPDYTIINNKSLEDLKVSVKYMLEYFLKE